VNNKGIKYLILFTIGSLILTSWYPYFDKSVSFTDSEKKDSIIVKSSSKKLSTKKSGKRDTTLKDSALVDSIFDTTLKDSNLTDSIIRDSIIGDSILGKIIQRDSALLDSEVYEPLLSDPIHGKNRDSLVYNLVTKDVFAWRNGEVTYQDMKLNADYITINTDTKNIRAEGLYPADTANLADSLKVKTRPVFSQKNDKYEVDSMVYNMESGKAFIQGVNTKQGESIIWGGEVKKMPDNIIHMHKAKYTVCDADHPHFYLQMTKGTVVPDKNTVFGPAYMVIEDVPIYFLGVPFGFFPQTKERNSGIIIPEFGEEYVKGFFLRNGGYYFNLGDNFDLKLLGGIYTLGSWQVGLGSSYNKRYKYRGSFSFDYGANKIGDKNSTDYIDTKNIAVRWSHSMDNKSTRGLNFAASVNYTSSSYNKYQTQNINDYLSSQTSSSINLSKSWAGKPFTLSATASLSQNTRDSTISMNLPTISFNVSRITPFKRKHSVGKDRWYEKIAFTYGMNFKNDLSNIKENQLMQKDMFDKMRLGFNHNIPVSASFNHKGWLNITPSLSYQERWYFRSIEQNWDETSQSIIKDTTSGFYRVNNWNASLSANTKLYGTYTVGRKNPIFFRHLFTPSFGFSFTPDCGSKYYRTIQSDSTGNTIEYSPWSNELFGVPSKGRSAALTFSFGNTLEAKVHSDMDSTGYKKVKIIERLNISSNYNFIADSLNLSPFSFVMQTNIANKFPISFNATFDPYQVNENGTKINRYMIEKGHLLRMTNLSFSLGYGFQGGGKKEGSSNRTAVNNVYNNTNSMVNTAMNNKDTFFRQNEDNKDNSNALMNSNDLALMAASQYYDFSIPWSLSLSYNFSYSKPGNDATISQSANFNASVNLTDKWAISGSAGYDFAQGKVTPGTISIRRDLHCWQMSLTWVPVGFRQSWSFSLNVKSSMLTDILKAEKRNSFYDNIYGY